MAGKEAIVVILDVGQSMATPLASGTQTRMQAGAEATKLLIQQKLLFAKSHELGIVVMGSDETENDLNEDTGGYENITVLQEMDRPNLDTMKAMNLVQPTQSKADILDAIIVGMHMIQAHTGKRKYIRRLFLITDGDSPCSDLDQLPEIISQLNLMDIRLNIIAVGFDEGHLTPNQEIAAGVFRQFVQDTKCGIYSSNTAMKIYKQFRKRSIYPVAKYKGPFSIGFNHTIDVLIYGKVKEEPLPSMKKHSTFVEFQPEIGTGVVKMTRESALVDDPTNTVVDEVDIIKAYYYGISAVPITETDADLLLYQTRKSLKLLGFISEDEIPRHFYMSGVDIVLPDPKHATPFKALVQALFSRKEVALVRYCYRDKQAAKLAVLTPCIKPSMICLYLNILPTYEDYRDYGFPDLTESTPQQQAAMSDLIDALSLEGEDEDGDKYELLKPTSTFNPTLQYYYQCLTWRAENPDSDLPELDPNIEDYLRPDRFLMDQVQQQAAAIEGLFNLVEVEQPVREKKFYADTLKEETGKKPDNPEENKIREISEQNPINDFFTLLRDREVDLVTTAIAQMERIIIRLVENAFQGDTFPRAIDCLKNLRQGCLDEDEIDAFNTFLIEHIKRMQDYHGDFWNLVVTTGVMPITNSESDKSVISPEEARELMQQVEVKQKPVIEEEDDLMDIE